MTNPDKTKDRFYEEFDAVISAVPASDKLIILGDFNARVGCDSSSWEGVLGKHGTGKCNSNDLLLLQTCAKHDVLITNTVFRLPTRNKTSWMLPLSKHWHLIDYVVIRKRDRQDVRITKAMCGAECWTDHRLIVSKLNICVQPKRRPQGKKAPKRINITKLKDSPTKQVFVNTLEERLDAITLDKQDVEAAWTSPSETVYNAVVECLGPPARKHKDWFDENHSDISPAGAETRCSPSPHPGHNINSQEDALRSICSTVQLKLREMQDSWLSAKADEIQGFADRNYKKNFYSSLKAVYGSTSAGSFPLLSVDGTTLISEKDKILQRLAKHFDGVLNRQSSIND